MASDINGIKTLEKRVGTLQILVHLHNNKKATVTNLIRDAKLNQRTTYSALANLQEHGLICREETNGFPVCKYYMLTEKGEVVAEHLGDVARVLDR